MDISRILNELKAGRDRIDQVISAIESIDSAGRRSPSQPRATRKRGFSAATRARMAAAQKARWANVKRQGAASKPMRHLSRAARKRIAAAQRTRWAKIKQQQAA